MCDASLEEHKKQKLSKSLIISIEDNQPGSPVKTSTPTTASADDISPANIPLPKDSPMVKDLAAGLRNFESDLFASFKIAMQEILNGELNTIKEKVSNIESVLTQKN